MKRWHVLYQRKKSEDILTAVLKNRGLATEAEINQFLHPDHPHALTAADVGIDRQSLQAAIARIHRAITDQETIVVYGDYDVDGITGGAILWETLYKMGAPVMPYVPHRQQEGYGFSKAGIDNVKATFNPQLIISVDHGITAAEKISYAASLNIDVIVTDHHTLPHRAPEDAVAIVHTTNLSGAGVAWFLAKELIKGSPDVARLADEHIALAGMGTVADMVPLVGVNRRIALHGLHALNQVQRVGLRALFAEAGVTQGAIEAYHIGYTLGPRINAAGRITHALDALRLLCTTDAARARLLAADLGETNRQRQKILEQSLEHARGIVDTNSPLLFVADASYNQGVIGLIAGRLVEEFYKPAIVLATSGVYAKASARSVRGFDITQLLQTAQHLLVDVGGHPMAAGFTVETSKLPELKEFLSTTAARQLTTELLTPEIAIDTQVRLDELSLDTYQQLENLAPFGVGNPRPVFATKQVPVRRVRQIGRDRRHLKMLIGTPRASVEVVGFGMGERFAELTRAGYIDAAFTLSRNDWNNNPTLQLKLKDIRPTP